MAKSKKVNKWEAAPESIKLLHNAFTAFNTMSYEELDDKVDWDELDELLVDVLRAYNELEAKHNADCGLISKLEEENKTYKTLAAELHNDTDELERTINNLEEMVEFHKGEVKKLVKTADQVRDKHENEVCMLKKDISDFEVKVKYYKEDIEDLECEVSKYKALYEGLESTLQKDLDAAKLDLKKEGEHSQALSKVITRKNTEMCNLKWQRDESEKKIKILTEELMRLYGIHVTFYQRPGIDIYGNRNIGVHVDCDENRNAFNELKEALDKHKSQIDKLVSALSKCNLEAKWDDDDRTWHVYVMSTGQIVESIEVDYCKVFGYVNELKDEIEKLKTELDDLKSKNRDWQIKCNNLKKGNEGLLDRNRKLSIGYTLYRDIVGSHYGLGDCHDCKNFDPKE